MPEGQLLDAIAAGDAAAIIESTEAKTAAALAPTTFADIPDFAIFQSPRGYGLTQVDLERYAETPRRKHSTIAVSTTASLAQYLNVHREPGTTVYADEAAFQVTAIINDHADEDAGHRDHRAVLTLVKTPACVRWFGAHARMMDQEKFAQLIEDGMYEVTDPDGATLLELVQTIHATSNAEFRSGMHLQTGVTQFSYVQEQTARAGGATGEIQIPEIITLVFAPFNGSVEPITLKARLRYRIAEGKLSLGLWLIRHEETIRAAFGDELDALKEATASATDDGLTALWGEPGV